MANGHTPELEAQRPDEGAQAFLAEYDLEVPTSRPIKVVSKRGSFEIRVTEGATPADVASILNEAGVQATLLDAPKWGDADPVVRKRVEQFVKASETDGVSGSRYRIKVETPTALGQGEHRRRRKAVEEFLTREGVSFTIECFTKHSSDVCRRIAGAPEEG